MKLSGLVLAPDASAYLSSQFSSVSIDVVKRFIVCVLSHAKLEGNRVSKSVCEDILSEWMSDSTSSEQFFRSINAMEVQHVILHFNISTVKPLLAPPPPVSRQHPLNAVFLRTCCRAHLALVVLVRHRTS